MWTRQGRRHDHRRPPDAHRCRRSHPGVLQRSRLAGRSSLRWLGGHCRQPKRNTKVHTLDDGLINTAVHSIKACLGCLPLGIHLVGNLVRRRLQAIVLRRKSWAEKKEMGQQAGEARMIKPNEDIKPVMASQSCFRWSSYSACSMPNFLETSPSSSRASSLSWRNLSASS